MKEINDQFGNLRVVALQSKMAAEHEMYLSIGQVALEGIGSGRDERRIVLSPYSKQGRLIIPMMGSSILTSNPININ
jgi:hypothetical protein